MYKIKRLCFFLGCVLAISACRSARQVSQTKTVETVKTETIIQKDTVFKTEADSSFYQAWIDCQNGKPHIKRGSIQSSTGKTLSKPGVNLNGNTLQVDCEVKARDLFRAWKEKYTLEQKTEAIQIPVYKDRDLTWWQTTQIWIGRLALIILAGGLAILALKKYLKPF